jgi:hypothetical protein
MSWTKRRCKSATFAAAAPMDHGVNVIPSRDGPMSAPQLQAGPVGGNDVLFGNADAVHKPEYGVKLFHEGVGVSKACTVANMDPLVGRSAHEGSSPVWNDDVPV